MPVQWYLLKTWIGREEDRKQLITAIYIYVYSIRDEQEGK